MDLNALRLLFEIVEAGNLSEAARRMKTSRSNISHRLQQFEREVGHQLLRRTTRRLEPTDIGLRLSELGRAVHDAGQAATECVVSIGDVPRGRVRIAAPSGFGQVVMGDWLVEFKLLYPEIVLDVMFENRVSDLLSAEVDLCVRVIPTPPENLVARDLGPIRYVACASRTYAQREGMPERLDQLASVPLVCSSVIGKKLTITGYRGEERVQVLLEPTVISENMLFLRKAILAGVGVGIVPDYVIQQDIDRGDVVIGLPDWRLSIFGTRMYLMYMSNRRHTRAVSLLVEFILNRTGAWKAPSIS